MTGPGEGRDVGASGQADWELCLFVAGMTPAAERALRNVRRLCTKHLRDRYSLEVIDLREDPMQAERHQILAVPTLIRRSPGPSRRVIGDCSDDARVLAGLELSDGRRE